MRCLDAEDLRGDDVEEPVTPGDFSKIDDAVGDQHLPVEGVAMPVFRADDSERLAADEQGVSVVCMNCSNRPCRRAHPAGDVSPGAGCGA